ncbi:MAG: hypothetical protein AAGP08_15445, partial [Pseudomonadota bacterium]
LRGISGFWTSLCALTEASAAHGEVDTATKQMVYVIGVSFTLELAMKAAYEETLGRIFATLRGSERAELDDLSARQATEYAAFLQQTPWYKWDFRADRAALIEAETERLRDRERRIALGLEYGAKAAYAGVIAEAVANVGADELTLQMVVRGSVPPLPDVTEISRDGDDVILQTPRYRVLTHLMVEMAAAGVDFIEIAGNDQILFTAISDAAAAPANAIASLPRQGYDDMRHLILVDVIDLADRLRGLADEGLLLEHIHDY